MRAAYRGVPKRGGKAGEIVQIIMTVALATAGGLCARKIGIPGGMLVGALLAVTGFSMLTGQAFLWPQTRILAQVLTGAYIGGMICMEDLRRIPKIVGPYLMIIGCFAVVNMVTAFSIFYLTDLDFVTCLFCAMPGGITDAPLIAMDMGADVVSVTAMQLVRLLFGMGCLPTIIMWIGRKRHEADTAAAIGPVQKNRASLCRFLPVLAAALTAGLIGRRTGIPAGTMTFSLTATALLKLTKDVPPMPPWLRKAAQVITGCCIGSLITIEQVIAMKQMLLPAVILCLNYLLCCVGGGMLLRRVFGLDRCIAMLALSPAGATEMTLIAADLGIEDVDLVVLQICRLVGVLMLFPQLFALLLRFSGRT